MTECTFTYRVKLPWWAWPMVWSAVLFARTCLIFGMPMDNDYAENLAANLGRIIVSRAKLIPIQIFGRKALGDTVPDAE